MTNIHNRLLQGKNNKYDQLTASDNLDTAFYKIGGHKQKGQEFRGVKVSYLIKTPKPLRVGDEYLSPKNKKTPTAEFGGRNNDYINEIV